MLMVRPRITEIVGHPNAYSAAAVGILTALALSFLNLPAVTPSVSIIDMVGPCLGVTGFGLAIAITTVAVVMVLPRGRVLALMVLNEPGKPKVQVVEREGRLTIQGSEAGSDISHLQEATLSRSHYLDLVFVFVWTALANLSASVAVLIWGGAFGSDELLSSQNVPTNVATAVVAALFVYAILQMTSALRATYQFAAVAQAAFQAAIVNDSLDQS